MPPSDERLLARPLGAVVVLILAFLAWRLSDVLLLTFLAIVLASALQPVHAALSRVGVPRSVAVVAAYAGVLVVVAVAAVVIVPIVVERITSFAVDVPRHYDAGLAALRGSRLRLLRLMGARLPPLESLPSTFSGMVSLASVRGVFGLTTGALAAFSLAVATFALSLYWALDVPRVERLVLSLVRVEHRAEALSIWHQLEARLGAFVRGQMLVMLVVGIAITAGYAVIGLPDAIVLGFFAAICEAVPVVGPLLAAVPAILLALPLGSGTVLAVAAWATVVQMVESHVLMPRVMSHAVGLSALASLVALLVLGSLAGPLGVVSAIPAAVLLQVIAERSLLADGTAAETVAGPPATLHGLRARAHNLRMRLRERLRRREGPMGIDPASPDHLGDAVDQRLETAVERIVRGLAAAQAAARALPPAESARVLRELDEAVRGIEVATAQLDGAAGPDPLRRAEGVHAAVERATALLQRLDGGLTPQPASTKLPG